MAESRLDIRVRAFVDGLSKLSELGKGLEEVLAATSQLGPKAQEGGAGITGLGTSSQGAGNALSKFKKETQDLDKTFGGLITKLKQTVVAYLAFLGVSSLGGLIKDSAEAAARVETLGITLRVVGTNAGYSEEQLNIFEKQVKDLGITSAVAKEALTKLIQSGISLGSVNEGAASTAARLARASQDLAVVTGQNSSETLQRLITNISQLDTVGLRFQGLIVQREAAEAKFAATLGKTSDQLNQQQKTQAFLNATLDEAAKLQGTYEASLSSVGKQVQSLKRHQEELSVSIGVSLLPAYGAIAEAAEKTLKTLRSLAVTLQESDAGDTFGEGVSIAVEGISKTVVDLATLLAGLADEFADASIPLGLLIQNLGVLVSTIVGVRGDTNLFATDIRLLGFVFAGLADGVTIVKVALEFLTERAARGAASLSEYMSSIASLFDADLASKLQAQADELSAFADKMGDSAGKSVDAFARGETALAAYTAAIEKSAKAQSELAESSPAYDALAEKIRVLLEANREFTITNAELEVAVVSVTSELAELGKTGDLTGEQVKSLSRSVANLNTKIGVELSKALQEAKLKLIEIGGKTYLTAPNAEVANMVSVVNSLADVAEVAEGALIEAFSKGVGAAKTLTDLNSMAVAVDTLRSKAESSAEAISKAKVELAKLALQTTESAGKSLDELAALEAAAINKVNAAKEQSTQSQRVLESALQITTASFGKLFDAQLAAAKSSTDFARLAAEVTQLGIKGTITGDQVTAAMTRIGAQAELNAEKLKTGELSTQLGTLGVSFEKFFGKVSEKSQQVITAFEGIVTGGRLSAGQLTSVFASAAGQVDSIQALTDLTKAYADNAKKAIAEVDTSTTAGALKAEALRQAMQGAIGASQKQLEVLVDQGLQSAKTSEDFARLTQEVVDYGEKTGGLGASGQLALDRISEAATGAKEATQLAAQAARSYAQDVAALAQAESQLGRATLEVDRAKFELQQAINRDKREGTDLSRAEVRVQESQLRLAQAQEDLARSTLALKQQEFVQSQAQNKLEQAQFALEKAKTEADREVAAQRVIAAERELAARTKATDQSLQLVANQQGVVAGLELASAQAQSLRDRLAETADEAKNVDNTVDSMARKTRTVTVDVSDFASKLREAGASADEVNAAVQQELKTLTQFIDTTGAGIRVVADQMSRHRLQIEEDQQRQIRNFENIAQAAENIRSSYDKVKQANSDTTSESVKAILAAREHSGAAKAVSDAYKEIALDAARSSESAKSAAQSFLNNVLGLREELLKAQGLEEDAAKIRFGNRRRELDLEYTFLRVKLQSALATAREAGLTQEATDLVRLLGEVQQSYNDGVKDLGKIQDIEFEKLKKRKEEQRRSDQQRQSNLREETGLVEGLSQTYTNLSSSQNQQPNRGGNTPSLGGGGLFGGNTPNIPAQSTLFNPIAPRTSNGRLLDTGGASNISQVNQSPSALNLTINGSVFGADRDTLMTELARVLLPAIVSVQRRGF